MTALTAVSAFADETGRVYAGISDYDFSVLPEDEETGTDQETGGEDGQSEKPAHSVRPENLEIDPDIQIADGIYAGSEEGEMISLAGMNAAQAGQAIAELYDRLASDTFTVTGGGETFSTTLYDLGFTCDLSGMVEEAVFLGQYGGLIRRYKELTDIRADKVVFSAKYSLSEQKVDAFIKNNIASRDAEAKDASLTREGGEFVVTPSVTGWRTDVAATRENILRAVENGLTYGMSAQAEVELDIPYKTTEALSQVQDRLGSFTTDYSNSKEGRKVNIRVGSGNLNGLLVMPGDSVSVSTAMKERTPENGYELAGEYAEGATVDAYGGGVCQVATTLYNALLKAEIQIDKRSNHSMLVSYVQPSFDAAISWGTKDLVFTNDTGAPIYIASSCDGATLTFSVYGKEYRSPNHKVVYESVVVERKKSESIIKEDPTQPVTYELKEGSNHDECVSYLKKMVYEDGELVDTVQLKTDYYNASFQTITKGTLPVETTPDPSAESTEETTLEPGEDPDDPPESGEVPDSSEDEPDSTEETQEKKTKKQTTEAETTPEPADDGDQSAEDDVDSGE